MMIKKFQKPAGCICHLILIAVLSNISFAAERTPPQLDIRVLKRGASIVFTITPSESAAGCNYTIYGSGSRRGLKKSPTSKRIIGTAKGSISSTELRADGVKNLKIPKRNGKNKVKPRRKLLFFLVIQECNTIVLKSNIAFARIKMQDKRRLPRLRKWFKLLHNRITAGKVEVVEAFTNLSFNFPVDLQQAGDGTNRLFLVEQSGKIYVFNNSKDAASKHLFLDISDKILFSGEEGLLGLAFHPNYKTNGFFYIHYSRKITGDSAIARYSVSSKDPNTANPTSELLLLTVDQSDSVHNGGQLAFGPDGFLYFGFGDGGPQKDPFKQGQNRTTLLGSLLRVDVNNPSRGKNYGIPSDNPFVGNASSFREEIYAYGLRNPWRFSFDTADGTLWLGDVGQSTREEVDIIKKGGNYGWNIMEGSKCFLSLQDCNTTGLELPIAEYSHTLGRAITGGYVYRGSINKPLLGKYVYGDFSGRIWTLTFANNKGTVIDLADTDIAISSFGTDQNNELYFLGLFSGKIYTFQSGQDS